MVLTKAQKKADVEYILKTVFGLDDDSELHKAVDRARFTSPLDFGTILEEDINQLTYADDNGALQPLSKSYVGHLKAFKAYIAYRITNGQAIDDDEWSKLDPVEYDKFCISP